MSMSARMLISFANAVRDGHAPQHSFAWTHCCRVLASYLIGEGV